MPVSSGVGCFLFSSYSALTSWVVVIMLVMGRHVAFYDKSLARGIKKVVALIC